MGRLFSFIGLLVVAGAGMYIYAHQAEGSSAATGTNNPKAAINITGVRSDLMTIAQAERGYFALEGKYASLDQLISSRSLTISRERPPYSYEVETSASGFRVIATRSGNADPGTPSQLSVDDSMQFQTTP